MMLLCVVVSGGVIAVLDVCVRWCDVDDDESEIFDSGCECDVWLMVNVMIMMCWINCDCVMVVVWLIDCVEVIGWFWFGFILWMFFF